MLELRYNILFTLQAYSSVKDFTYIGYLCQLMDLSKGKRQIIWYLEKKGKTGSYILREMQNSLDDEYPLKATIYRWIERFDNGDEELHDDPRQARPTSSKTSSNIERAQTILDEER
ncbi:Mariner transposase [Oopsacas minuta]|uniref:Mariner transposase n=1 Tax=Oopsacas minuta TaxID=111878 RepID=A0AAV7KAY3_9METZ|nr:Mariner transposase [Oopsacas minuta]